MDDAWSFSWKILCFIHGFSNRSLSFPLDMEAQNTVTVCLKDGQNTKK